MIIVGTIELILNDKQVLVKATGDSPLKVGSDLECFELIRGPDGRSVQLPKGKLRVESSQVDPGMYVLCVIERTERSVVRRKQDWLSALSALGGAEETREVTHVVGVSAELDKDQSINAKVGAIKVGDVLGVQ